MDALFLCRPCIEKMPQYQTVGRVDIGSAAGRKGTCDMCCCRRFGYNCKVEFVEATHSIIDLDISDFPHFKPIEKGSRFYHGSAQIQSYRNSRKKRRTSA